MVLNSRRLVLAREVLQSETAAMEIVTFNEKHANTITRENTLDLFSDGTKVSRSEAENAKTHWILNVLNLAGDVYR